MGRNSVAPCNAPNNIAYKMSMAWQYTGEGWKSKVLKENGGAEAQCNKKRRPIIDQPACIII